MAFFPLERLQNGNVDFVYGLSEYDSLTLINNIRNSSNRIAIINGFLPLLKTNLPFFCFNVIYDIPEFINEAHQLFDINYMTPQMLNNLFYCSRLGLTLLLENFDVFVTNEDYFAYIIRYIFDSDNEDLIYRLSRYKDLHVRFLFMEYLVKNRPHMIDSIYDDIRKYTTSMTNEPNEQIAFFPELMSSEDISRLAVLLLDANRDKDYENLKEFILENYPYNYLASNLLTFDYREDEKILPKRRKCFESDADRLFDTSQDYRLKIFYDYYYVIRSEKLKEFEDCIKPFLDDEDPKSRINPIYSRGLGPALEGFVKKYKSISKSDEYGFIAAGSTCSCFRVGDFAFKLITAKHSYEDEICPDGFIIVKNYETLLKRDENGRVVAGIEVQPFLTRSTKNLDPKYFDLFDEELKKLGYRRTDTLTNGECGDNTMLLDSYLDADCADPESLPEWFKETPLVLIDRDMVYPISKTYVKQDCVSFH